MNHQSRWKDVTVIFIYVSSKFSLLGGGTGVKPGVKWVINWPICHKSHIKMLYLDHKSQEQVRRCDSDIHLCVTQIQPFWGGMGVKPGVELAIIYSFFYKSDIKMLNLGYRSYRWVGRCDSDIFLCITQIYLFLGGEDTRVKQGGTRDGTTKGRSTTKGRF